MNLFSLVATPVFKTFIWLLPRALSEDMFFITNTSFQYPVHGPKQLCGLIRSHIVNVDKGFCEVENGRHQATPALRMKSHEEESGREASLGRSICRQFTTDSAGCAAILANSTQRLRFWCRFSPARRPTRACWTSAATPNTRHSTSR